MIKIKSVKSQLEGDDVGYIRLASFNEKTDSGVQDAINDAEGQGRRQAAGIVLDLRNNPGGLLDQAVAVAGRSSTRARSSRPAAAIRGHAALQRPGATTCRRPAAGGADQRRHRLGLRNRLRRPAGSPPRDPPRHPLFGKGSVQTIIPLPGHGAVRLTTARYYTPSGRSIQQGHRARPRGRAGQDRGLAAAQMLARPLHGALKNDTRRRERPPATPAKRGDSKAAPAATPTPGRRRGAAAPNRPVFGDPATTTSSPARSTCCAASRCSTHQQGPIEHT